MNTTNNFKLKKRSCSEITETTVTPNAKRRRIEPQIILDTFTLHGKTYETEKIGSGKFHKVLTFKNNEEIVINNETLKTNDLVIKYIIPLVAPQKFKSVMQEDIATFKYLSLTNIPTPKCYIQPNTFIDDINPENGNFWIFERMDRKVTTVNEDQTLLEFVKNVLTNMAKEQKEVINDFYPRNVMYSKNNELKIVDAGLPQKKWERNLFSYLKAWSNMDKETFDTLTEQFPDKTKIEMTKRFAEEKPKTPFVVSLKKFRIPKV